MTLERAKFFGDRWGSDFVNIGDTGHINVTSGYTNWDEGLKILQRIN